MNHIRKIWLVLLIFIPNKVWATYSLVSSNSAGSTDTTSVATTLNTNGTNFFVVSISDANDQTPCNLTDSFSNTFAQGAIFNTAGQPARVRVFYNTNTSNPGIGPSHTFTCSSAPISTYPAISVMAFSGAPNSPLDISIANGANSVSVGQFQVSTSNLTPSQANSLIVSVASYYVSTSTTINQGFAFGNTIVSHNPGSTFGVSSAYLIQGNIGPVNPTWTVSPNTSYYAGFNISFKASTTTGNTYYVSLTGNNANSCTTAMSPGTSAKRHLINDGLPGASSCLLNPGDTVIVQAGTYTTGFDRISEPLETYSSGTIGNPVTFKCEAFRACILAPADCVNVPCNLYVADIETRNWIVIQDFVLDGTGTQYNTVITGGDHNVFQGNDIKGAWNLNVGLAGTNNALIRNLVHDNRLDLVAPNCGYGVYTHNPGSIFDGNEFYRNCGFAIHLYPPGSDNHDNIIRNNSFHDNGYGHVVNGAQSLAEDIVMYGDNHQVYNNVFYNSIAGAVRMMQSTNIQMYNNTIWNDGTDPGRYGIWVNGGANGAQVINNIVLDSATPINDLAGASYANNICNSSSAGCTPSLNSTATTEFVSTTSTDPLFLHLKSGAKARNNGTNFSNLFTSDKDGILRPPSPTAWDIGAYQFASSGITLSVSTLQNIVLSEILSINESIINPPLLTINKIESFITSEFSNVNIRMFVTGISDSISNNELVTALLPYLTINQLDTITTAEILSLLMIFLVIIANEPILIVDIPTIFIPILNTFVTETIGDQDSPNIIILSISGLPVFASDSIHLTEIFNLLIPFIQFNLFETVTMSELASQVQDRLIPQNLLDITTLSEFTNIFMRGISPFVIDAIAQTELIQILIQQNLDAYYRRYLGDINV